MGGTSQTFTDETHQQLVTQNVCCIKKDELEIHVLVFSGQLQLVHAALLRL